MDQATAPEMSEAVDNQRINFRKWVWRVLTWDGFVPVVKFGLPYLVLGLFPNLKGDDVPLFARVIVVVANVSVRTFIGLNFIYSNSCCWKTRQRQELALVFGVALLAIFDWIMAHLVLGADLKMPAEFVLPVSISLYVTSLSLLIFSLYPGREPTLNSQLGNWKVEC